MTCRLDSKKASCAMRSAAVLVVALGAAYPSNEAKAQSSFIAYAAACQSDCFYGPTAFWTPPDGATSSSSVSHSWSYIGTGTDTSYNYSASAAAQASISGANKWAASSSASGYFSSPGTFTGNGVAGTGIVLVRDEFTLSSTPSWSGPGWFRLSYRITGDAAVNYAETSSVSGQTLGFAQSSISFECGSARVGGAGSSRCESPDFAPPQSGDLNLYGRLDFDSSQSVDRIVTFNIPVYSDSLYAYRLQTSVSSRLILNALNRTGQISGGTSADFSHTFSLVDAQLFDTGFNEVQQWSVVSASGFNYANLSAVPEPGTAALLAVGMGLVGWRSRRSSALDVTRLRSIG